MPDTTTKFKIILATEFHPYASYHNGYAHHFHNKDGTNTGLDDPYNHLHMQQIPSLDLYNEGYQQGIKDSKVALERLVQAQQALHKLSDLPPDGPYLLDGNDVLTELDRLLEKRE